MLAVSACGSSGASDSPIAPPSPAPAADVSDSEESESARLPEPLISPSLHTPEGADYACLSVAHEYFPEGLDVTLLSQPPRLSEHQDTGTWTVHGRAETSDRDGATERWTIECLVAPERQLGWHVMSVSVSVSP